LENVGVGGRIIKCIERKKGVEAWIGLIWLRKGAVGGL
jgi:hypothetical protein